MPRTPSEGRLPRGPRYARRAAALAGPAVLAATLAAAGGCASPLAAPAAAGRQAAARVTAANTGSAPPDAARSTPAAPGRPAATAPAPAAAGAPATTSGASSSRRLQGPVHRVTGTVVRLSVETTGGHDGRTASVATYVRTADGPEKVSGDGLDGVPTGSTVVTDLAEGPPPNASGTTNGAGDPPAPAGAGAGTGAAVLATRVLATPPPAARLAPAVHDVTTVLALPPGAKADATTSAGLAAAVNGPVNRFWSVQSGGRLKFRVTHSVGWLRTRSRCDDAWGLWAEVAARVGFVPGPRRHLLVLVPSAVPGCFAGLGTIGADPSAGGLAYVRGTLTGLIAHELGHNLGLGHSNGLLCDGASDAVFTAGSWPAGCHALAYRDWYDVMGVSWDHLGSLSTAQAYRLGVMQGPDVEAVSVPTRATLNAVGGHAGLRSMRVTVSGVTYVVEYRAAVGDDAWLRSDWRGLAPGVLVRRDDPDGQGQTLLLDATPSAGAPSSADWDAPIPVGAALTAAGGRLVVRVEAETDTTADVAVEIDGAQAASGPATPDRARAPLRMPAR